MAEIIAARAAYNRTEIMNIGLITGESNPFDELTKPWICTNLNEISYRGIDNSSALQWIYRIKK